MPADKARHDRIVTLVEQVLSRRAGGSGIMDGQPDRLAVRVRPLHAMPAAPIDVQAIAGMQDEGILPIVKAQTRASLQQDHPFVFVLIIPEPRRRAMTSGNNSLNAKAGRLKNGFKKFILQIPGNIGKEIFHCMRRRFISSFNAPFQLLL